MADSRSAEDSPQSFVEKQLANSVLFADAAEAAVEKFGEEIRPMLYQMWKERYGGSTQDRLDGVFRDNDTSGMFATSAAELSEEAKAAHVEAGYEEINVDMDPANRDRSFFCQSCTLWRPKGNEPTGGSCVAPVLAGRADGTINAFGCCIFWENPKLTTYSFTEHMNALAARASLRLAKERTTTLRKQKPEPGNLGNEVPLQNEYPTDVGPTRYPRDFLQEEQHHPRRFQEEEGEDPLDRDYWKGLQENKNVRASRLIAPVVGETYQTMGGDRYEVVGVTGDKVQLRILSSNFPRTPPGMVVEWDKMGFMYSVQEGTVAKEAVLLAAGDESKAVEDDSHSQSAVERVQVPSGTSRGQTAADSDSVTKSWGQGRTPKRRKLHDPSKEMSDLTSDNAAPAFTKGGGVCYPAGVKMAADRAQEGGPKSLKAPELSADSRGGEKIVQGGDADMNEVVEILDEYAAHLRAEGRPSTDDSDLIEFIDKNYRDVSWPTRQKVHVEFDKQRRTGAKTPSGEAVPEVGDSYLAEDGRAYSVDRVYMDGGRHAVVVYEEDTQPRVSHILWADQINKKLSWGEWQKIGSNLSEIFPADQPQVPAPALFAGMK